MRNLKIFNIDENPLVSPPKDVLKQGMHTILDYLRRIFESRRTCRLELNGYHLTELPVEVCNLTYLTDLQLVNNEISGLPPDVMKLGQLLDLNLEDNHLEIVPAEFGSCTALTRLSLSFNRWNLALVSVCLSVCLSVYLSVCQGGLSSGAALR